MREDRFAKLVSSCRAVTDCMMVPGYERSFRGYHVLALGIDAWFNDRDILTWCDKVRSAGGITAVAHPVRYNHTIPSDILEAVDAVEVWNSKFAYDGRWGPNPRAYPLLGARRYPLCSQDLHGVRHASAVGVVLDGPAGTGADILSCLAGGRYRMTNGVVTFGSDLSKVSHGVLSTLHSARRQAVKSAIWLRKRLRSKRHA